MPSTSAVYVASTSAGSSSVAPWMLWAGESRMPTFSGPIASATARVTSMPNRARRAGLPPYSSVRSLEPGARNWWIR